MNTVKENFITDNKEHIQYSAIKLGRVRSDAILIDPKSMLFVLARYNFAAQMALYNFENNDCPDNKKILELGCSEGIGAAMMTHQRADIYYTGVDLDQNAIEEAIVNWKDEQHTFIADDFLGKVYGVFDTVISLDVVEHIDKTNENEFFDTIYRNLSDHGIAIVGTPNITASEYASPHSKAAHINLFSQDRLKSAMETIFHNVFVFGLNDEVIHTGYDKMAHYLMALGCNKKFQ